jgi:hypothetical protein
MQRPLGTAPRSAIVHPAAIVIEYTVAIYDFHLYDVPRYPPVRLLYLVRPQLKSLYHPLLVVFIKGDGGFTMAAVAAAGMDVKLILITSTNLQILQSVPGHRAH